MSCPEQSSLFFYQLHDLVIFHPTLSGRKKSACALVFAEADKALCDGADEELWVLEIGLRVHKALQVAS
jgi:replication factor C subunit 2/4